MPEKSRKTCLLISIGPVPTPQYKNVEGTGMRTWGLAKGLKSHGVDVTVAINSSFPQEIDHHEGIGLVNWTLDAHFKDLMNSYDSVIALYTMGSNSEYIADNISDNVQLILDAYVPIYVEVSAREAEDM